jgi:hypothetical protein
MHFSTAGSGTTGRTRPGPVGRLSVLSALCGLTTKIIFIKIAQRKCKFLE